MLGQLQCGFWYRLELQSARFSLAPNRFFSASWSFPRFWLLSSPEFQLVSSRKMCSNIMVNSKFEFLDTWNPDCSHCLSYVPHTNWKCLIYNNFRLICTKNQDKSRWILGTFIVWRDKVCLKWKCVKLKCI